MITKRQGKVVCFLVMTGLWLAIGVIGTIKLVPLPAMLLGGTLYALFLVWLMFSSD